MAGGGRPDEASIRIPSGALVVLVGPPASGKSTFAAELVRQGKVDSAAVVASDDIAVQMFGPAEDREQADPQIFAERDRRVTTRLSAGVPVVVDATNVLPEARARLMAIAQRFSAPVLVLRVVQTHGVLITQNAERDKRLPVRQIYDYATLMAEYATSEQLRSQDVWAVHDVPGRDQLVCAAQAAAAFEFEGGGPPSAAHHGDRVSR